MSELMLEMAVIIAASWVSSAVVRGFGLEV
jgi:hypothetical protein